MFNKTKYVEFQLRDAVAKKAVCQKYKEMLGFTSRTVFLCKGTPLAREVITPLGSSSYSFRQDKTAAESYKLIIFILNL